ncbi:MAG TPA: type II secretion system protein M [Acidiferrobacterales bacterium]|nr:type II secretion system protein M [Acidiferrobacterales bacterium]
MNTEFLNPLREQWNKLAPGERRLAMIGGVVVGATLLYVLLWLPIQKELTRLRVSVPEERAQLQRMRAQAASIKPLRARSGAKPAPGTLLSVIEQSASARGLRSFVTRMEADGGNGVQLTLDAVPFNSLLSWLADLQDSHSLLIESTSMDAHSAPGTVNAKLKLRIENP